MSRRRLLDLFCGSGGAGAGYARAGFAVHGVDHLPMPAYPFTIEQGDALSALDDVGFCREFDAIHASPPCQAYTSLRTRQARSLRYPDLVDVVRDKLDRIGRPYVIENVVGAPLRDPVMLCGSMFGLGLDGAVLRRHRLFESNVELVAPPDACAGRAVVGVYGTGGTWRRIAPGGGGFKVAGIDAARAMGIDHTTRTSELAQAIPPAYTAHIGRALLAHLDELAA